MNNVKLKSWKSRQSRRVLTCYRKHLLKLEKRQINMEEYLLKKGEVDNGKS